MPTGRLMTALELLESLTQKATEELKPLVEMCCKRLMDEQKEQGKREGDLYRRINELERKCADREIIIKALVAQAHLAVCRDELKNGE